MNRFRFEFFVRLYQILRIALLTCSMHKRILQQKLPETIKKNTRNIRTPFEERVAKKKKRMIRKIDQNVILLEEIDLMNATALNPQSKLQRNERMNVRRNEENKTEGCAERI